MSVRCISASLRAPEVRRGVSPCSYRTGYEMLLRYCKASAGMGATADPENTLRISDARMSGTSYGAMFSEHIGQADEGCDFDFLRGTEPIPEPEIH
jgi:hypothetical protein